MEGRGGRISSQTDNLSHFMVNPIQIESFFCYLHIQVLTSATYIKINPYFVTYSVIFAFAIFLFTKSTVSGN